MDSDYSRANWVRRLSLVMSRDSACQWISRATSCRRTCSKHLCIVVPAVLRPRRGREQSDWRVAKWGSLMIYLDVHLHPLYCAVLLLVVSARQLSEDDTRRLWLP